MSKLIIAKNSVATTPNSTPIGPGLSIFVKKGKTTEPKIMRDTLPINSDKRSNCFSLNCGKGNILLFYSIKNRIT